LHDYTVFRHLGAVTHVYGAQCRSLFQSLAAALVLTKLDFGNATLAGIPSFQLDHLQSVMNAVARLVFQTSRYDHINPLLCRLHWVTDFLCRIAYLSS